MKFAIRGLLNYAKKRDFKGVSLHVLCLVMANFVPIAVSQWRIKEIKPVTLAINELHNGQKI